MRKLEVMENDIADTQDMKCPVCGTVDEVDEFIIHFYRCKMCRTDLALVDSDEKLEAAG